MFGLLAGRKHSLIDSNVRVFYTLNMAPINIAQYLYLICTYYCTICRFSSLPISSRFTSFPAQRASSIFAADPIVTMLSAIILCSTNIFPAIGIDLFFDCDSLSPGNAQLHKATSGAET